MSSYGQPGAPSQQQQQYSSNGGGGFGQQQQYNAGGFSSGGTSMRSLSSQQSYSHLFISTAMCFALHLAELAGLGWIMMSHQMQKLMSHLAACSDTCGQITHRTLHLLLPNHSSLQQDSTPIELRCKILMYRKHGLSIFFISKRSSFQSFLRTFWGKVTTSGIVIGAGTNPFNSAPQSGFGGGQNMGGQSQSGFGGGFQVDTPLHIM